MSLRSYPEYVASPIHWLEKQPSKWSAKPVKAIASINDETLTEALDPGHQIEYVDIGSVSLTNGIEKTESMAFGESPSRARRVPREGDVLVSTVRTYLKAIAPVVNQPSNLVASTGFAVIRPKPGLEPGFLKYLLQEEHFIQEVIARSTGVSYPAINASDIGRVLVCVPSSTEQLAIASFLDHETAKIDALIADQQRLIELLQEKRQSVISHAVIKGLNPNALMKDSGVEWLGEVPEHWEVKKIKHVGTIRYGIGEPPEYKEQGVPLIRATNVCSGEITKENMAYVNPTDIPSKRIIWLKEGDIIVVRSGALTGDSAIIKSEHEGSIAGFDMVLECTEIMPLFAQYCLLSPELKAAQIDISKQRAAQPHLNSEELGQCLIAVPQATEQQEICYYLDQELYDSKSLIDKSLSMKALLRERRSALISAAVTGQIDVRELVEAEGSEQ